MKHRTRGSAGRSNVQTQSRFAHIPSVSIPRSSFDRSHGLKTTFDAGKLIPIFVDEALPGDTFSLTMSTFARLATALHPIMDNIHMDVHFFAVPNRLVWDNWQKFMGEQDAPGDSIDFMVPQITAPASVGWIQQSLGDYMGIPTDIADLTSNALHFRAYNLIFNTWFRDENITPPAVVPKDDGPDSPTPFVVQRRLKRHDYFTSCLPWPQKGDAVSLPLGLTAPVISNDTAPLWVDTADTLGPYTLEAKNSTVNTDWSGQGSSGGNTMKFNDANTGLVANLAGATAATINSIREAFQIQKLLERDARGGTRYTEILRSHFGVHSPDERLQRPEYLGGGSTTIVMSPVPQTSETTGASPLGELGAYGIAAQTFKGWTKSFTEHCVLIGIVSVRADLNYQQGQNKMWDRQSRYDYYWPSFAHLGEQAVLQKEIFADGVLANDNIVFGYQERFAEYRYKPSLITGKLRSQSPAGLETWHLAIDFASAPVLNQAFLEENPDIDRIIAVPSEPHFIFDSYFQYKCVRPMPTYSVPGLIDHF